MKKVYFCLFAIFIFSACSSNALKQTPESRKSDFEQKFAEQCINNEIKNSVNKDVDRLRFTKPCQCIAKRIAQHLPKREMDKFLLEQKITHTLTISFDKAAYFCIQNAKQPKTLF
ncbi:MAG: hypothetical protein V3U87_10915 [Methylococcaceae bacterium]